MIEPARTRDDGLLRGKPFVRLDPRRDRLSGLDLGVLHIHGADADLLVADQPFIVGRHVVLDQIRGALDLANKVGLVATMVKISMANLTVVLLADGVVALAHMHGYVDRIREALDREIDGTDRGPYLLIIGYGE